MTKTGPSIEENPPNGDEPEFSPEAATRIVQDLAAYEEGLTARVVGLTLMFWGCFTFGLFFMTYSLAANGSAVDPDFGVGVIVIVSLACITATNALWKWRALSGNVGYRPWRVWGQGALLLVAAIIAMPLVDPTVFAGVDSSVSLTFVATILLSYLGIRSLRAPWRGTPWILISAGALLLADVALYLWAPVSLPRPDGHAYLAAALVTSAAVFLPGYMYFRRG